MSVFEVQLQNTQQGKLDRLFTTASLIGNGPTPGTQIPISLQRQVYIMGPGRNNMLLKDGATFTGSNYWKRFCYPQLPLNDAILNILTDDGSVYSDVAAENSAPYSWSATIANGTTYTLPANIYDILGTTGGYATFAQISNLDTSHNVTIQINGQATLTLPALASQVFNAGDLNVTKVAFANASGAGVAVQVFVAVMYNAQPTNIGYIGTYGNTTQGTVFPLGPGGTLS